MIGLFAALALAPAAFARTPSLTASGPIAQTEASHAFGAAAYTLKPETLSARGFVEEEFFVGGKANVYDWPQAGPAMVRTADVPYTTRVLVRRPSASAKFSGRVVVEMLNPSNLFDLNIGWAIHREELMRNGDAWVGITVKPVSMATLKAFDPQRYAGLALPNPLRQADPLNCEVRAAGGDSRQTENGLAWDINTQVGGWIRSGAASNPFRYGGQASRARYLYAWGYSQTGGYLYTYINAIHPLVVKADGKSMFDGYFVAMSGGPTPINQCAQPLPQGDQRRVIGAVGVPVVHVMSQSDYLGFVPQRRADADGQADRYRHYDLAGAGHATPDELYYAARSADTAKGGRPVPAMDCNEGPRSRFPSAVPMNAILRNLEAWVERRAAPPPSQNIVVKDGAPMLDSPRQRFGRRALALPRRAHEHLVGQLHRPILLLHRRSREAIRPGRAQGALPYARRLCLGGAGQRSTPGAGAVSHARGWRCSLSRCQARGRALGRVQP
ncbi:MAG: alpha/beta hydrolase domain-containing protein [Caulobacteraceae bacterium]